MKRDLRHRKSSLVIRLLLAIWIVVVIIVLGATGRWGGLVFVVPLILDLYLLRRSWRPAPARKLVGRRVGASLGGPGRRRGVGGRP